MIPVTHAVVRAMGSTAFMFANDTIYNPATQQLVAVIVAIPMVMTVQSVRMVNLLKRLPS